MVWESKLKLPSGFNTSLIMATYFSHFLYNPQDCLPCLLCSLRGSSAWHRCVSEVLVKLLWPASSPGQVPWSIFPGSIQPGQRRTSIKLQSCLWPPECEFSKIRNSGLSMKKCSSVWHCFHKSESIQNA